MLTCWLLAVSVTFLYNLKSNIYILCVYTEKPYRKPLDVNCLHSNIYSLGIFTYGKPLEFNVVYIPVIILNHAKLMTSK